MGTRNVLTQAGTGKPRILAWMLFAVAECIAPGSHAQDAAGDDAPVDVEEVTVTGTRQVDQAQDEFDHQQRERLGSMAIYMAAGILLMALISNLLRGRIIIVLCALIISTIGFLLKRSTKTGLTSA